jgi:hypothetical protein
MCVCAGGVRMAVYILAAYVLMMVACVHPLSLASREHSLYDQAHIVCIVTSGSVLCHPSRNPSMPDLLPTCRPHVRRGVCVCARSCVCARVGVCR